LQILGVRLFFSLQMYKKEVERLFENTNKVNKVTFIVKKVTFICIFEKKVVPLQPNMSLR